MGTGYYIALDFDGTVVKHRYPKVGEDIGAVPILRKIVSHGHNIILHTMRGHHTAEGDTLQPALDWFKGNGIQLFGVNNNPTQSNWTDSPKVYANVYIDDAALGAPLKVDKQDHTQYIDWNMVAVHLLLRGILSQEDIYDLIKEGSLNLGNLNIKLK